MQRSGVLGAVLAVGLLSGALVPVAAPDAASAATLASATTVTTAIPTQVTIGESVQFTLKVTLPGGRSYFNAAIIDTVSLGMTPVGSSSVTCVSAGSNCAADLPAASSGYALPSAGQRIGWLLGSVASRTADRVVTVVFSARLDDVARNAIAGNPTNSALLQFNDDEAAAPPSNAASTTFTSSGPASSFVIRVKEPALGITLAVSDVTPAPGEVFRYTATLTNANATYSSTAYAAQATVAIPDGVVVDPSTITGGATLVGSVITWSPPDPIAKNGAVTFGFSATLAATSTLSGAAITTTARVTHYQSLASGGRSYPSAPVSASATVIPDFPVLVLSKKTADTAVAYADEPFAWVVEVTNTGRTAATDLEVIDLLPANWAPDGSALLSIDGATPISIATAASEIDPGSRRITLTWAGLGVLNAGSTATIRYTATPQPAALVDPGLGDLAAHLNSASATARDHTGSAGSASAPFSAQSSAVAHIDSADIQLEFLATGALAGTTSPTAWTLVVANAGPDAAVGPFIVSDVPELVNGVRVSSAAGTGWSCTTPDEISAEFSCVRLDANETLPAGEQFPAIEVAASIDADAASGTVLRNSASVSARTWDPDRSNNSLSAQGAVETSADLAVVASTEGSLAAGQTATWAIDASNIGPSVSREPITVTVDFPAGVTDESVAGTDWTCSGASPQTCTYLGDLAVTGAPRLTATALLDGSLVGDATLTVAVQGTTADPEPSNNTADTSATVLSETALLFEKSLDNAVLVPGTTAEYSFTVENRGLADARGVVITDALPSGLVFEALVGASPGSWQCVETVVTPSTVRCALTGAIAGKGVETLTIAVTVPSSLTGEVINSASVSADNAPSVTDIDETGLTGVSDLGITSTHDDAQVVAGTSFTQAIVVHNYGPADEPSGVIVIHSAATGFDPVSGEGVGWACDAPVAQNITCTSLVTAVAAQSLPQLTFTVSTPADAGAALFTSITSVKGALDEPIPDEHSNTTEDVVELTTLASIVIVKQIASGEVTLVAGESIDYTIAVTNSGPSIANAVVVAGFLPPGFTIAGYSGAGWDCAVETLVCSRSELGVETSVITVTVMTASDLLDGSVVTNSSEASWTDSRAARGTDTASVQVTIEAVADLLLTKMPTESAPNAGAEVIWSLAVENRGSSDAIDPITITDTLPAGIRYVSAPSEWSCSALDALPVDPQVVTCVGAGDASLAAGGTAILLNLVTSSAPTLGLQTVENTASVQSPTTEAVPADNTATASVTFGESADISVDVTSAASGLIGGSSTFTIALYNAGPSSAGVVSTSVQLPRGLEFVDILGGEAGWSCADARGDAGVTTVSCGLTGFVGPGSFAPDLVVRVTVAAAAYSLATVLVSAASSVDDPDIANNSDEASMAVAPLVRFAVTKSHDAVLTVHATVTYRVDVSNAGPTEDPGGFSVVDTLPEGLAFVGYSGDNVMCTQSDARVTCTFGGALAVDATRSVFLTARVLPSAPSELVNVVEAESLYEQLSPEDAHAEDSGVVQRRADDTWLAGTGVVRSTTPLLLVACMLLLGGLMIRSRRAVRP